VDDNWLLFGAARDAFYHECDPDRHRSLRSVTATRRGLKTTRDSEPVRPVPALAIQLVDRHSKVGPISAWPMRF
jgi:hypothetical protein